MNVVIIDGGSVVVNIVMIDGGSVVRTPDCQSRGWGSSPPVGVSKLVQFCSPLIACVCRNTKK